MWSKQKDETGTTQYPKPVRASVPQHAAVPSSMPPSRAAAAPTATATIGPSMRIKGEIYTREELMVDGDVEGTVESESLLTVGTNGKVKAKAYCRTKPKGK